ncbi:hypothetical protein [Peribacillus sp. SI8-4]|uniref:hypothetical protein n=1 Tax=Peribacillus sp. SI8-4 TaxID=3048009 RepID=UPI002556266E|nr:hypothetical protein [Peribacillus sp. SI8-4]
MTIITKKEAVMKYGNKEQITHFVKYNKFKSKTVEDAVIKTMEQYFEYVKTIKNTNGRGHVYELGVEKEEKSIREDGRISNGTWKIPYTKNLDIVVVSLLEQGLETKTAQTLANWAIDFGVITKELKEVLQTRYHEGLRKSHVEDLKENKIISFGEERIIDDFAQITKELINQIAGTLNRMAKAGIIEFYPIHKGHIKETVENVNLHEDIHKEVTTLRRNLMEKYDIDDWYMGKYKNAKKTVEFQKEYSEKLALVKDENGKVLGLDYCFTEYVIILKARKKKIIRYLEKYNNEAIELFKQDEQKFLDENKQQFHDKRKERVLDEAQKNVDKFFKPREVENPLNAELGGKKKKCLPEVEGYTYDAEYYKLYFEGLYVKRIVQLQDYYGYNVFTNVGVS